MVFEHRSLTTIESRRWQEAVQLTLCSETHVVGFPRVLVWALWDSPLGLAQNPGAKYFCFTF